MNAKRKKACISIISASAIAISTMIFALSISSGYNDEPSLGKGFDGHTAECEWNHYSGKEANYATAGNKEFWACCTHPGNHVLVQPPEGHITDRGAFTGTLEAGDDRLLPKLMLGVVALDAETGSFRDTKGYAPSYDLSKGADENYGAYMQLDNWQCNTAKEQCWLTYSDTARTQSAIEAELGGEIVNFFFYIYNPLEEQFLMKIMFKSSSGPNPAINYNLSSKKWTKINVDFGHLDNGSYPALTSASQIGFTHVFSGNGQVVGSGWKFTSIYAEKAASGAIDPAPHGVVALDAQTGSFRDIKGYAPSYELSHDIDGLHGAYMQLDNWQCNSAKEQCWLTYSDTARSQADIETDLGKAVTNYFFYIYNPLEEQFLMKIMFKSSSGPNPNINYNLPSKEWTKIVVDYGHADNGSYPALTSASQIGFTHVFSGNGQVVGSGWKFTSIYAE